MTRVTETIEGEEAILAALVRCIKEALSFRIVIENGTEYLFGVCFRIEHGAVYGRCPNGQSTGVTIMYARRLEILEPAT